MFCTLPHFLRNKKVFLLKAQTVLMPFKLTQLTTKVEVKLCQQKVFSRSLTGVLCSIGISTDDFFIVDCLRMGMEWIHIMYSSKSHCFFPVLLRHYITGRMAGCRVAFAMNLSFSQVQPLALLYFCFLKINDLPQ